MLRASLTGRNNPYDFDLLLNRYIHLPGSPCLSLGIVSLSISSLFVRKIDAGRYHGGGNEHDGELERSTAANHSRLTAPDCVNDSG